MRFREASHNRQRFISIVIIFSLLLILPPPAEPYSRKELRSYQRSIVDDRSKLNRRFKKVKRKKTKYIIVHTSELGLKATRRVVSKGKRMRNGRTTKGGHTHYVIARNGRTYRILDKKYKADHAGRSMWNGERNISNVSIGIELVGYHYANITDSQYRSLGSLIKILQKTYRLNDKAVLTHSQVAYGKPNRWFKKNHRGRKRCAKNFIRSKAGLGPTWSYDPDVRAGRLSFDPQLASVFYGKRRPVVKTVASSDSSNVISKSNSAWSIAGEDYDSSTTVYQFPNGKVYRGNEIAAKMGWDRIPADTVVLLNQEKTKITAKKKEIVKTISERMTAWSFAGRKYNHKSTIYFLPSGRVKLGSTISDWDDLPINTRLIVGYRGPYRINKNRSAIRIAGDKYRDRKTIYYLPTKKILAGNQIKDFKRLPRDTMVFLPAAS